MLARGRVCGSLHGVNLGICIPASLHPMFHPQIKRSDWKLRAVYSDISPTLWQTVSHELGKSLSLHLTGRGMDLVCLELVRTQPGVGGGECVGPGSISIH